MNADPHDLKPWQLSHSLTFTRTIGEVMLVKNGTELNIWIRVDGKPMWFSVCAREVADFLVPTDEPFGGDGNKMVFRAESDGNAEKEPA